MWLGLGVRRSLSRIHARYSKMNACYHFEHWWLHLREVGQYVMIQSRWRDRERSHLHCKSVYESDLWLVLSSQSRPWHPEYRTDHIWQIMLQGEAFAVPPFPTSSDISVFTSGNDDYFLYLVQEKLSCDLCILVIIPYRIFNWLEVKESAYLFQCPLGHPGELGCWAEI